MVGYCIASFLNSGNNEQENNNNDLFLSRLLEAVPFQGYAVIVGNCSWALSCTDYNLDLALPLSLHTPGSNIKELD